MRRTARLRALPAAAMALALLAAPAGAAAPEREWGAYGNSRFNFAVCFPPTFRGQGEATNRDGQRFRTRDGAELAAYGTYLPGERVDSGLADDLRELAGAPTNVTYRASKADWVVASGAGPKGEFYVKRVRRGDERLSWELLYPARLHALYAPLTARMLACFTHGSEAGE